MTASSILLALTLLPASLLPAPNAADGEPVTAIRAGKLVWNAEADKATYDPGVVVFQGKKILAVGPAATTPIPAGATVVDAKDAWVVPGIIDLHNHTGGSSPDLHDYVYLTNPDLRMIDAVQPESVEMHDALVGGVSAVLTIPGSGNNMSGFGVLQKTGGLSAEESLIRFPGAMKIAQAGNPESYMGGVGRSLMNWSTRSQLTRGRDYAAKMQGKSPDERRKSPDFNPQLELMIPIFAHDVPIAVHTQIHQVVASTLRILNKDMGVDAFTDHSEFNGYIDAPEAIAYGVSVVCGPRGFYRDPAENRIRGLMAEWHERGVKNVGTNTDSPVVPEQELPYQAAMGVRLGFPDTKLALRGVTILAARIMKVEDRIGSLEPGKDADIGVWTGDPIDPRSRVQRMYVNGKLVYDEKSEGMRH